MSRQINRLTEVMVRNAKPEETVVPVSDRVLRAVRQHPGFSRAEKMLKGAVQVIRDGKPVIVRYKHTYLADGLGLYLAVSANPDDGAVRKSYLFRFSLPEKITSKNGKVRQKQRWAGIGSAVTLTLKEARERARAMRKMRLDGLDPIAVKRGQKAEAMIANAKSLMTFSEAALGYIADHAASWSEKHARVWRQTVDDYLNPVLGEIPCAAIDDALVIRALSLLFKTNYPTAKRLRGRGESVLDWATVHGHRPKDTPNAFRWRGHLSVLFGNHNGGSSIIKHMPSLEWQAVPQFMAELAKVEGVAARALEWCILTTARTGSVLACGWPEIDETTKVWNIPADHMKRGVSLRIPISPEALDVLEKVDRTSSDKVFSITKDAMFLLVKRINPTITVHGFRNSFADFGLEHGCGWDEINEALGHQVGNAVSRAYLRSDVLERRRALMVAWGAFAMGRGQATGAEQMAKQAPFAAI